MIPLSPSKHRHQPQILPIDKLNTTDEPCLTALPEMNSLSEVVNTILNQAVTLQRLQASGAEGRSGCSIYFARSDQSEVPIAVVKVYPPQRQGDLFDELASYKKILSLPNTPSAVAPIGVGRTRDEESGAPAGVVVYQPAKGKAINTMIRDVGRITAFRDLARNVVIDYEARDGLLQFIEDNRENIPVDWREVDGLKGRCVDGFFAALPAFLETRYEKLLEDLLCAVRAMASVLAKLHTAERGQWNDASEKTMEKMRTRVRGWMEEIQSSATVEYDNAGIGPDRRQEMHKMVEHVIYEARHPTSTSLTHGDASSGNFFWDPAIGVTMIDYGGLHWSMDVAGKPIGLAEIDAAGFYERLRKYAPAFGVKPEDIGSVQEAFWDTYTQLNPELNLSVARLVRLRIQMSRLWSAVDKFNRTPDASHAAVETEYERLCSISGIHETVPKFKVLMVANASGRGKGGIPLLNRELVNAMASLKNASVTLFLVDDAITNEHHPNAKVISIPCASGHSASELLYYVAKVHQPQGFGLPEQNEISPPFDLIVGHSRYSSAAAAIIRDRWYPTAKLALITHTSPLRKSDAAWTWYGGSRQKGYEEAARLALLDEKILPKADLAIGVGPVLTNEAREREWMGQLSRPRSIVSGPRFHEMIPGVHIEESIKRQRQPDDVFRVLLAGRADDPAKGVDDAIYAVWQLAMAPRASITLDILGVPAEELQERQKHVDQMTGIKGLVQFHPFSNDQTVVRRSYQAADLVVMPSTHEGFGMIFTEVAGMGVPILVTEDSGAGQFALDSSRIPARLGNAVVVMDESAYGIPASAQSNRVAIWADRIDWIRRNPVQAMQNATELQDIMRAYSWEHAAEALLDAAMHDAGDTVQTANGTLSPRLSPLAPEVKVSMQCAAQSRNGSGVPEKTKATAVLQTLPRIGHCKHALEHFVSKALGHHVDLKPLTDSHVKGFSGAPVFIAHHPKQGGEVAVVKLFLQSLDNGITEELSSLEWLLHRAKDINTPTPIAVGQMSWNGKPAGVVAYKVAQGASLYQLMMQLGKKCGKERAEIFAILKSGSQAAATTLTKLHSYAIQGRSSEGYLAWYYSAAPQRVDRLESFTSILEHTGLDVYQLRQQVNKLIARCQQEIRQNPRTAVVHGDAHPGNFFFDRNTKRTTIIDVTTLHCSLDAEGNPAGTPERDVGHFLHMLRRTGEQSGMTEDEMEQCARVFVDTYYNGGGSVGIQTLRLLAVCSALSFVGNAVQKNGNVLKEVKILGEMFALGNGS
ncbi:hypothetical protein ASPWEDRAFT_43960 [Aspergillus wentii DTO 134E9]|uniref:Aminoglycoside phosphotransferase domain-containing protein n=1 Tax=Aspergillus wentii DTO 134E9 TaxID=1073089 RepID=A0A1L9RAP8_ASPWE|nr:uncharacterized protein ASPWEDRAFT_43960 [Aspergillus wentii DTO 134E9]KAI9934538.1 hypothetical protein MW887_000152 [Aspergillus wentii]OJJ31953.1 hypothetical protein ASPWEDRAFT_43960 [Aspergillus wentii DTO 134E9]